jgi:outer membrane lipoprotein LolB
VSFPGRWHNRWIFNVFLFVLCAGCASVTVPPPGPEGFVVRGKLAVVEGEQSVSARFIWRQTGEAFRIDLWGPFGQGQMRLEGDGRELVLRDAAGEVLTRGTSDEVMRGRLGWTLPLTVLPEWVQGRPHPGLPSSDRATDAEGRLASFRQLDWTVALGRYGAPKNVSSGRKMPHQVSARRGIYRVRLAISEWQI